MLEGVFVVQIEVVAQFHAQIVQFDGPAVVVVEGLEGVLGAALFVRDFLQQVAHVL